MLTCKRCTQICPPDGPLNMGLAEEKREAAFVGGCLIELWTKMADNNTARHIEAKNAKDREENIRKEYHKNLTRIPSEGKNREENIREETILKPDSDLFPTTILF